MITVILLALGILSSPAVNAGYASSPVNSFKLTDLQLTDESGKVDSIGNIISKSPENIILVPAYFNCNSTCQLLAENIRDSVQASLKGQKAQVVFLSFNPQDGKPDIEMFRMHHKLPQSWHLLVAKDESKARDFLQQFGYQFQKINGGYDHPNAAYILSGKRQLWTGTLVGNNNTGKDIDQAMGEADYAELSGPVQTVVQYLSKPEYLIAIGFFGIIVPLMVILFVLFRRKSKDSKATI